MTINLENEQKLEIPFNYEEMAGQIVEKILDEEKCPYEAEVNVLLTDNDQIHQINLDNRGIDAPTDVLSFPMVDYTTPADFSHLEEDSEDYFNFDTGELMLGDIVVSLEKVREQATAYGHSETRELGFLIAHSMLHLFGYDHIDEAERAKMEDRQREILDGLGIHR